MDPSLRQDQAETFAAILKEMGETAKSPEIVQEISVAVKQVDAGKQSISLQLMCWFLITVWLFSHKLFIF